MRVVVTALIALVVAFFLAARASAEPPLPPPTPNLVTDTLPPENTVLAANAFVFFLGETNDFGTPDIVQGGRLVEPVDVMRNAWVVDPRLLPSPPSAGASFTLSATCLECDVTRTWVMGEEDDVEAPVVDEEPIEQERLTRSSEDGFVSLMLVPAIRDAQPRIVMITDGGARHLYVAARAAPTVVEHPLLANVNATGEHCIDVDALDLSMNTTRIATHCVSLDDAVDVTEPGCASTSPTLISAFACVLLLMRRRIAR